MDERPMEIAALPQAPLVPAERRRKRRWSRAERAREAEARLDDSRLYNLTLDVNALRQEIRAATQQLAAAETRARAEREAANVRLRALCAGVAQLFERRRPAAEAAAFAQTHAHERLALNGRDVGRAGLLAQTRAIGRLLRVRAAKVEVVHVWNDAGDGDGAVVETRVQLTGRLRRQALESAFPGARRRPELAAEALAHASRRLKMGLRAALVVDRRCGQIAACSLTLDVLSALRPALPRAGLPGVAALMDGAPFDAFGLLTDAELTRELARRTEKRRDACADADAAPSLSLSLPLSLPPSRHSIAFILSPSTS